MHMSDFNNQDGEHLSRRQVAERLVDIAYALTAGGPLELNIDGRRITVPVAAELRLGRELRSEGDSVALALELTWTMPEGTSAAERSRGD
jgi:amphi-Trp domain-containing protein